MTLKLPRLSMSAPVVTGQGFALPSFVQWWNSVCTAIETNINGLASQQAQIDEVLGIANSANASASTATSAAEYAQQQAAGVLVPIPNGNVLANTSGSAAKPIGTALTTVIDTAIGSAQGDILYRSATGWSVLSPGTAAQTLHTGGAGANPYWA